MKPTLPEKFNFSKSLIIIALAGLVILGMFFWPNQGYAVFNQTDWSGGPSTIIFKIPWGTSGSWNKYTSAQGVITDNTGVGQKESNAFLISSVFDLGSRRVNEILAPVGINYASGDTFLFRGSNDQNTIGSAEWTRSGCLSDFRYVQYQIKFGEPFLAPDSKVPKVSFFDIEISVRGMVTDVSSGGGIKAKINFDDTEILTGDGKGILKLGQYSKFIPFNVDKKSYKMTASAEGYQVQTKEIGYQLTPDPYRCVSQVGHTVPEYVNFALSPIGATQPPPEQPPTVSPPTPTPKPPVPTSLNKVELPSIFTREGSVTTDLNKIKDSKKVENFILEVIGKNKVIFRDTLDLSEQKTITTFSELDKYLNLDILGKIELDSKAIPVLNKKATLTMFNLPFLWTPKVLVDGKKNPEIVSNINYQNGTLTFDVSYFTKFEAVPTFEILEPGVETSASSDQLIKIKGKISDPKAIVSAKLNGEYLGLIFVDPKTGQFEKEISLKEGQNEILISAVSSFGETQTIKRTINYLPPKEIFPYLIGGGVLVLLIVIGFGLWYRKRKKSSKVSISA